MEFLDAKTIFVLSAVFSALISVVFYAIYRGVYTMIDGVASFAGAFAFYTLFAVLLLLRAKLPAFTGIVLANTAFCLCLLCLVHGFARLKNLSLHRYWCYLYPLFCLTAFSWFTYVVPSFAGRIMVTTMMTFLMFGWLLKQLLVRNWRTMPLGNAILVLALTVSIFASVARLVIGFDSAAEDWQLSILAYQGLQAQYLITQLVTIIFIAVGLIVLIQDQLRQELENVASYDMLTGVFTRRMIVDILEKMVAQLARSKKTMSVMMLDIDHFKQINDRYGHCVGDLVLKSISDEIERVLRKDSYIGRYGGEEFLIVMPDTGEKELVEMAQRILNAVSSCKIIHGKEVIQCTVSIGALPISSRDIAWRKNPIQFADEALYQAKAQGRNTVVTAAYTITPMMVSA